jgi:hypothetical protein
MFEILNIFNQVAYFLNEKTLLSKNESMAERYIDTSKFSNGGKMTDEELEKAASFYFSDRFNLTLQYLYDDLKQFTEWQTGLNDGTISPRQIVGTGYKNARKVAENWLKERIQLTKYLIENFEEKNVLTQEQREALKNDSKINIEPKYYIFEGYDNFKSKPLYRVESTSESENEYVGEWHEDKKLAEEELGQLNSKVKSYSSGGKIDFYTSLGLTSKEDFFSSIYGNRELYEKTERKLNVDRTNNKLNDWQSSFNDTMAVLFSLYYSNNENHIQLKNNKTRKDFFDEQIQKYYKDKQFSSGGELLKVEVVINSDYENPKKFRNFHAAKKYVTDNVNKANHEIIDQYGDSIYIEKGSTKEDLDWLFSNIKLD